MMQRPAVLLLVLLLGLLPPPPAAAQDPIRVRGGVHADYVRMVFDWPAPVSYTARIEVGRLVLLFPKGHSFDFAPARRILRKYLILPDGAVGGRRLAFPLLGDFELRHFTSGPRVVVDLLRRPKADPKPAEPKPAEPKPAEAKPAEARPAEAAPKPSEAPAARDMAAGKAAEPAAARPAITVRVGRHPGYGRLVFDWPEAVPYRVSAEAGQVRLSFGRAASFDLGGLRRRLPPQVRDLEVAFAPDGMTVTLTVPPAAKVRHFTSGPKVALDILHDGKASATAAPKRAAKAPTPLTKPRPGRKAASGRPPATRGEALRAAAATVTRRLPPEDQARPLPGPQAPPAPEISIQLPWTRGAKAAAFRRGKNVWLAFDRKAPEGLREGFAPEFGPLKRIDQAGGTLLHFEAPAGFEPALRRVDGLWTVKLHRRPVAPLRGLKAKFSDDLRAMLVPLGGAGPVFQVTDPSFGDRLFVVPVAGQGLGAGVERALPEFHILPAFQGLVIQTLSDAIRVARNRDEVMLTGRGPLTLAGGTIDLATEEAAQPQRPRLLDLVAWRGPKGEAFTSLRQKRQSAVVAARPRAKPSARLELARFLFAHGFASEALGHLEGVLRERPDLARSPQVVLMRAAARFLRDDFEAAAKILDDPGLAGEWEAELWRAAVAARAQDWEAAASGFARTAGLIADYPPLVRARLWLLAAEAALQNGNTAVASERLAELAADRPPQGQQDRLRFLQGLRAEIDGDAASARRIWKQVAQGQDRPARARARLALVDLDLAQKKISPEEAIAELERLRFAWRGDYFEFALLERLADLYLGQLDYRKALNMLRQTASYLKDFRRSEAVGQKMRAIFAQVYLGGGGDKLPPLTALGLYEDFRELTPVGAEGDRMIAALADRLVEVDLLDEAGDLLQAQVKDRLSGREKARVGARLALIRLLDTAPAEALKALDASAARGLPADLDRERRYLRAKALAGVNRGAEALKIIEAETSRAALELRAEIETKLGRWAAVAKTLSRLLPETPAEGELPPEPGRKTILSVAVALTLAKDRAGLQALKQRFGASMARTAERETFALLVDAEAGGGAPIAEVLSRAGHAEAFLASYRKRLADGQLSELN
ncbi:MAG: hypothetical protein QNJ30_11810 [Kiloniellales bacterium]|nr:hypothetical protein [Kiloniellales bacterium]